MVNPKEIMAIRSLQVDPLEQFYHAVVPVVHVNGSERHYLQSAFLIAAGWTGLSGRTPESGAPYYVATAQHGIREALNRGGHIALSMQVALDTGVNSVDLMVPNQTWYHDGIDSSVAPLDPYGIVGSPLNTFIGIGQFYDAMQHWFAPGYGLLSTDVKLIGLWAREAEPRVVLIRSGNLAAPALVRATLEVLPAAKQYCETDVYIVDGFVSSGMSGGVAALSTGRGLAEIALLGMIQDAGLQERRAYRQHEQTEILPMPFPLWQYGC